MTMLISLFGIAGRAAGDLLTTALGWASSLLFGRVPRSHQIYLVWMMAGAFLWIVIVLCLVIPSVASLLIATTPHPASVSISAIQVALLIGAVAIPPLVGLAGHLVPADGEREIGPLTLVVDLLRGYLLAPVIAGLLVFLSIVGVARKVRSRRHGWSDAHVPIVVEPGGYDQVVVDIRTALTTAGLRTAAADAPRVLTAPAWLLTRVAGDNVRKLRPDRLIELIGPDLRIGVYPSDIAISGAVGTRIRARAAVLACLVTSAAHMTTSAEAQEMEDQLERIAATRDLRRLDDLDTKLLAFAVPTDEWDVLYRMRLQVELRASNPGVPGLRTIRPAVDPVRSGLPDPIDQPKASAVPRPEGVTP